VLFIEFSTIIVRKSLCGKMLEGAQSDLVMTGCSFQRRLLARTDFDGHWHDYCNSIAEKKLNGNQASSVSMRQLTL
jgi:hypothetical protein